MHRNLYIFANLFLGLTVAAGLLQSLIRFQLGPQIFTLQSFAEWLLVTYIISLIGSLFLLKYYHYKKYWFTFSTGTIATITLLCHVIIIYVILVAGAWQSYNIPTLILFLVAGIVYAISLIFSRAGKRPWLKAAGVFMLIIDVVLLSALIWGMNSPEVQTNGTLEKIIQWISLAGSLGPVLFIMNFLGELKLLKAENPHAPMRKSLENVLGLMGMIAFAFTVGFGVMLATESASLSNWINRGPERAQRLAEPFEAHTYVNSEGDTMRYRLLRPLDYDPNKEYPLVVCLHGGAGRGNDNVKQIEGSWTAQMLSNQYNREKYSAFLFVPQCPPDAIWGGAPNYPGVDALVFETIGALEKEFGIDAKRRYVMGESLGGYGTWHFVSTRPEMFAAAVPICGGGNPDLAQNIADVPVWAFHGAKDRSVPVRFSRDMIEAIKKAGGNPRYTEYPDEGHIISEPLFNTPDLLDWVFAQQRE